MCIKIEGTLNRVAQAQTKTGKKYNRLSIFVNHGKFDEILRVDDFSGQTRKTGDCDIVAIPSSFLSKAGNHGINWRIPGGGL